VAAAKDFAAKRHRPLPAVHSSAWFGGFCRFLEENKSVPFFSINIHLDMVCHKWYTYQERRKDHAH
jgi:hypothetical protein